MLESQYMQIGDAVFDQLVEIHII